MVLDLNALVSRTAGLLRRTLGDDVQVRLELDRDLKPIKADPSQLEQVVLNLAVNARDAMPRGGLFVIKTSKHLAGPLDRGPAGEYARLSISDTGCGIPEEIQSKVFDSFFTTKGTAGTGLGLASVYGVVTQCGGNIRLASSAGAGTTFTIDLPVTSESPAADAAAGASSPAIDACARILIVEDDPGVRQLAEMVLRRAGHDVVAVAGAQEALAVVGRRSDLNLVLTDVMMPEMNGYDLSVEIRKVVPRARIVFMSGFACDAVVQSGASAFLAKPFTVASLTDAVQRACATAA